MATSSQAAKKLQLLCLMYLAHIQRKRKAREERRWRVRRLNHNWSEDGEFRKLVQEMRAMEEKKHQQYFRMSSAKFEDEERLCEEMRRFPVATKQVSEPVLLLKTGDAQDPSTPSSSSTSSSTSTSGLFSPTTSRKRKRRPTPFEDAVVHRLNQMDTAKQKQSAEDHFGVMVADMLKRLPAHERVEAKYEIHKLLHEKQEKVLEKEYTK